MIMTPPESTPAASTAPQSRASIAPAAGARLEKASPQASVKRRAITRVNTYIAGHLGAAPPAGVGLAYLFGVALGWGLAGVRAGFAFDFTCRGLLFWTRFRGGKWQTLRV
jgi:hypothetical protein